MITQTNISKQNISERTNRPNDSINNFSEIHRQDINISIWKRCVDAASVPFTQTRAGLPTSDRLQLHCCSSTIVRRIRELVPLSESVFRFCRRFFR